MKRLACLLLLISTPALSHDIYNGLINPRTKKSCCNGQDCERTKAYYDNHGMYVMFQGHKKYIPEIAVVDKTLKDGNAHVCINKETGEVYCFFPAGSMF